MEDDDPVVQEIPVFLSQALKDHLYIYQYPGKPANREWGDAKIVKAEIKPKNQIVKLEVGLDTYSDKYCVSKGEQIALNTDGQQEYSRKVKEKDEQDGPYFSDGIMDKIMYESSRPCHNTQHYAVAILQDKELHCTPVKGILQLRPMCTYLDKQSRKKKEDKNKSEDEEEQPVQQVTVKFARQETDVAKKAREKSYEFVSRKNEEEPWYSATYKHHGTDLGELERLKLLCASVEAGASLVVGGPQYARALHPLARAHRPPHAAPTLPDLCRTLLASGKPLRFAEIESAARWSLGGVVTEGALLSALGGVGVVLGGVWVARHAHAHASALGTPTHVMDAVRDHLIYVLCRDQSVSWSSLLATCPLPAPDLRALLAPLAVRTAHDTHTLRDRDPDFCRAHPDLVQRHRALCQAREKAYREMFLPEASPKRARNKSHSGGDKRPRDTP